MKVHAACPYCRCLDADLDGVGTMNPAAPYFALVIEVDRLVWAETTAKHAAARDRRNAA